MNTVKIWIVTYMDEDIPFVVPFNNKESAMAYFNDMSRIYKKVYTDECFIQSHVTE